MTDGFLLLSHTVRKSRKDPSATANKQRLGSTGLALLSQTPAQGWPGSRATSQDFPLPSTKLQLPKNLSALGFAFLDQMLRCHTAQNSCQQGGFDLCQYHDRFDLFPAIIYTRTVASGSLLYFQINGKLLLQRSRLGECISFALRRRKPTLLTCGQLSRLCEERKGQVSQLSFFLPCITKSFSGAISHNCGPRAPFDDPKYAQLREISANDCKRMRSYPKLAPQGVISGGWAVITRV